ncbi:MAG: hypothetical protein HOE85_14375, partial [Nitrospinaceae bacterium]|nr:hypothetical protein [Nitrospinaceae bacterium]
SRSRAWAITGNFLASESYCTYRPQRPGSDKTASNTYRSDHATASSLSRAEVNAALMKPE